MENSAYYLRLGNIIFSMFGDKGFVQDEKLIDPETGYKTKKGVFQRFMELIGEVADEHILPVIDNLNQHLNGLNLIYFYHPTLPSK